jgi:hypothetical protein
VQKVINPILIAGKWVKKTWLGGTFAHKIFAILAMLVKKAKTLSNMESLSTSSVSRFTQDIFDFAGNVVGNLLDKWDTLQRPAQTPYFLRL